jgi:pimeloyl-ACP methyl ester carboxylesterase
VTSDGSIGDLVRDAAASADGQRIQFEVGGEGDRTLVFVHGWSCDRRYWAEQMTAFADRYHVVAIDLAGHGESGTGRRSWTIPAFGDDVAAVLERLDIRGGVLIGHSMGGDAIVETALLVPHRVAALVWVDTYRELGEVRSSDEVERFVELLRLDFVAETRRFVHGMFPATTDPALVERIAADMSAATPEIAVDAARHSFANDGPILERLAMLRQRECPIVAINPEVPPTDAASLSRYGVTTVLMPNVGHFPMLEDAERFDEVLENVLLRFDGMVH